MLPLSARRVTTFIQYQAWSNRSSQGIILTETHYNTIGTGLDYQSVGWLTFAGCIWFQIGSIFINGLRSQQYTQDARWLPYFRCLTVTNQIRWEGSNIEYIIRETICIVNLNKKSVVLVEVVKETYHMMKLSIRLCTIFLNCHDLHKISSKLAISMKITTQFTIKVYIL